MTEQERPFDSDLVVTHSDLGNGDTEQADNYAEADAASFSDLDVDADADANVDVDPEQADIETWSEEYDRLIQNPPKEGDIIGSADDSKAVLVVELKPKSPPFVYGRAYVPEIVSAQLGWFLQSVESQGFHGWKCILMPRARTALIQRCGLKSDVVEITSLKVIRPSKSGKSLLCEVHEY